MAGVGGFGSRSGTARGLSAGPEKAFRPAWIPCVRLWAPGPGMHSLPCRLRFWDEGRPRELSIVHGRGERSYRGLWRISVRRTWRRAGARAISAEDVRGRSGAGVPGVQGDLGPAGKDEPGEGCRSVRD